jgi:hypothetical protein
MADLLGTHLSNDGRLIDTDQRPGDDRVVAQDEDSDNEAEAQVAAVSDADNLDADNKDEGEELPLPKIDFTVCP